MLFVCQKRYLSIVRIHDIWKYLWSAKLSFDLFFFFSFLVHTSYNFPDHGPASEIISFRCCSDVIHTMITFHVDDIDYEMQNNLSIFQRGCDFLWFLLEKFMKTDPICCSWKCNAWITHRAYKFFLLILFKIYWRQVQYVVFEGRKS